MQAFDAHAHLRPDIAEAHKLLTVMDECEIKQTFVVGGGLLSPSTISARLRSNSIPLEAPEIPFTNARLLAICEATSSRLLPFFFGNPLQDVELYRIIGQRFSGLKLGPVIHGVPFTDPSVSQIFELASRFKHVVYTHVLDRSGFEVEDLINLSSQFPQVKIILGHGGTHAFDLQAIDLIKPFANIFFETSGSYAFAIRHALRMLGSERIVFGSEYPLQDPGSEIQKIKRLGFSDVDTANILHNTAAGLRGYR